MLSPQSSTPATEPYPDLRAALLWTALAVVGAAVIGAFFAGLGILVAVGIGQAFGIGGVATLAARRVPEPQAERIGLRGIEWPLLPIVLCLVPAVLVASELDNLAHDASKVLTPPAIAEESPGTDIDADADARARLIDPDDPWSLVQAGIILVGISPVVEEFLFRGVIQQGLVARYGLHRGIAVVALFSALLRPGSLDGVVRFGAGLLAFFGLGWLLGIARVATGSILAPIALASIWSAVGLTALALEERIALPGLNVEGSHLPFLVTLASVALVAWSARILQRVATLRLAHEERLRDVDTDSDSDGDGDGHDRSD